MKQDYNMCVWRTYYHLINNMTRQEDCGLLIVSCSIRVYQGLEGRCTQYIVMRSVSTLLPFLFFTLAKVSSKEMHDVGITTLSINYRKFDHQDDIEGGGRSIHWIWGSYLVWI